MALKDREVSLANAQEHGLLPDLSVFLFQISLFLLDFLFLYFAPPDSLTQE